MRIYHCALVAQQVTKGKVPSRHRNRSTMLFGIALGAADQSFIYIEELFFGVNVILYPIALCALSQVQCSGQGACRS